VFRFLLVLVLASIPGTTLQAFQNEKTLDESALDENTLAWLKMARDREAQDPRMKRFKEDFEKTLLQVQELQSREGHKRVIIVGQVVVGHDGSIPNFPLQSSCKILDYGIFVGCPIVDEDKTEFSVFDPSLKYQKISETVQVPQKARIVHLGKVSLRLSDEGNVDAGASDTPHFTVRVKAERVPWTTAVKISVKELDSEKNVLNEEFYEFNRTGDVIFEVKNKTPYLFSLINEEGEILKSRSNTFHGVQNMKRTFPLSFPPPPRSR